MDRLERGQSLAAALVAAAQASDRTLVVQRAKSELPEGHVRSGAVEIEAELLPGGLVSAQFGHRHKELPPRQPTRLVDPSDAASTDALAEEVERLLYLAPDDAITMHVKADVSLAGRPPDEPWVLRPSAMYLHERFKAVRAGRGGVVAIAVVEQPRAVVHLAVAGGPGGLRVTGTLVERLAPGRRRQPFGRWRLRGRSGEAERILVDTISALAAFEPAALEGQVATVAVRLERNAAAVRAARSFETPLIVAWCAAVAVGAVISLGGYRGTGVFADPTLRGEGPGPLISVWVLAALGTLPAYVAATVAVRVMDRLDVRWTAERLVGVGVALGTYAAWIVAVFVTPLPWAALVALLVLGTAALLCLLAVLGWLLENEPGRTAGPVPPRRLVVPWLAVLAGALLVVAIVGGSLAGGDGETSYLLLVALVIGGVATGMAARRVPARAAVASIGIGVGFISIVLGAVGFATSGVEGLLAIVIGLPAITWSCAAGGWWIAARLGALRGHPAAQR